MLKRNFFIGVFFLGIMAFIFAGSASAADAASAPKGGFGLSLGPSIVRVSGKPGETQKSSVRVWNQSQSPMDVTVDIYDLGNRKAENGQLERVFPPAGTLPYSCAASVQLPMSQMTIEPGTFQDVSLLVAIPADLSGGRSAVVFFRGAAKESPETEKQADASGKPTATVQIQPRIGVLVFVEADGTVRRSGKIEDFKIQPPAEGEALRLNYSFTNTGNTDILLSGTFYLLSKDKALAAKGNLNSFRTFPGDSGLGQTVWEGVLDPGQYHLVASFELGPDTQQVIVQEADLVITDEHA